MEFPSRQMWFYSLGGLVVRAEDWRSRDPPEWYAMEGDEKWTQVDPSMDLDSLVKRDRKPAKASPKRRK